MSNPSFDFNSVIVKTMNDAGMFNMNERAQFLGQLAEESGSGVFMHEIWGPTAAQLGYEGRADLGNTEPGDGFKFRGRGFIQITGRDVYTQAGNYLGIDLVNNPDQASDPVIAGKIAIWFWRVYKHQIPPFAQAGNTYEVTRLINGGTNGLSQRIALVGSYMKRADLVTVSQAVIDAFNNAQAPQPVAQTAPPVDTSSDNSDSQDENQFPPGNRVTP